MATFCNTKMDSLKIFEFILLSLPISVELKTVFDKFTDLFFIFDNQQGSVRQLLELTSLKLFYPIAE